MGTTLINDTRLKEEERSYHTFMESPLLETRACPSCPGLIAGADPHHLCFEYLGDQDMTEAVPFTFAIPAGRMALFAEED